MSRRSCMSFMLMGILMCSAAFALQPTVRAGSISLNSGVKPTPSTVTSTTGSTSTASTVSTTDRGATIGKFTMPKAVPVSTGSNNNSVSSAILDDLQQQIDELRRDQAALANSQLKASDVEDTIEAQVKTLNLTTTNHDLQEALSEIRSTNQDLQTSVNSIQQQTNQISDTFTNRVDDRLKVVGVMDSNNNLVFVQKSDVTPQAIANKIVADSTATATLTNKIQKSDDNVKSLVDSTLIERNLLNQDKSVKVATTDQIPTINESTVVSALQNNNSATFKQMVDNAVRERYMSGDTTATLVTTKNISNQIPSDVVRTSGGKIDAGALPDSVVTLNSDNKIDEGKIPTTIARAAEVTSNTNELNTLKNKVLDSDGNMRSTGVDSNAVNGLIEQKLKDKNILDNSGNLQVATDNAVSNLTSDVNTLKANAVTDTNLSGKLKELNVLDKDGNVNAGVDTGTVNGLIEQKLKDKNILDNSGNLAISTGDGLTESQVNTIVDGKMTGVITTSNLAENNIVTLDNSGHIDSSKLSSDIARTSALSAYATSSALSTALSGLASESYVDAKMASMSTGFEFKGACGWSSAQTSCSTDQNSQACTFNNKLYICGCSGNNCTYSTLDMGADGASFNFKGSCGASAPTACNKTQQGDACTFGNSLYICSCTGNSCSYIGTQIVPDPVELTYCKENISKVSQLYSDITDVSKCDLFTSERYAAVIGGARTYCLSIMQGTIDINSDMGKRLARTFTSDKISAFASATLAQRKTMTGFKKSDSDQNATFLDACEARYNEIMTGINAVPVETQYCLDNFDIVKALYSNTTDDCSNFTNARYTAIMGGAKAYCLSLVRDPTVLGDLSSGIGKKLSDKLGSTPMAAFINTNTNNTPAKRLALGGFKISKTGTSTGKFMEACEARYDEIMSGENGETAWHAYCSANNNLANIITPLYSNITRCEDFGEAEYRAILGGAQAYCLSLTQDIVSGRMTNFDSGIGKKLVAQVAGGDKSKLSALKGKDMQAVMTSDSYKFDGLNLVKACEAKYNEIMAGEKGAKGTDGTNGTNGASAAELWCFKHVTDNVTELKLTPAKMMHMYELNPNIGARIIVAKDGKGNSTGTFKSLDDCIAAVTADPRIMEGESASDKAFNESDLAKDFAANSTFFDKFSTHKSGFVNSLKGESGKNGTDGKTFRPTCNASTGICTFIAGTDLSNATFDVADASVKAVKRNLNGGTDTSDSLQNLIDARAQTKANAVLSNNMNSLMTIGDFYDIINSGVVKIGNNAATINTSGASNTNSTGYNKLSQTMSQCTNQSDCGGTVGIAPLAVSHD